MIRMKLMMLIGASVITGLAQGETVVSLNADSQVSGTDFTTHYGGGVSNQANVVFGISGGGFPAITNGQVKGGTTYSAPDVYAVNSRSEFKGNFGVGNGGASGWRIRLNNTVTDGGAYFSDNLFAVENVSFDAANDTLDISNLFVSDMAAVSAGTVRFVVRDGGSFYISESAGNIQTGALDGNLTTNFSIEALSAAWFEYNPTVNPSANGVADIGAAASPSFAAMDFIGFHMEVTTAAAGSIAGGHNGCNFGVKVFTAQAVVPSEPDPWTKQEYFDFESDAAGTAFGPNWVNSGMLGSRWNFGGPTTIAADGVGSLVVSNHQDDVTRKLPKENTANAEVAADQYANPLTNGTYRLELDLNGWSLDGSAPLNKSMTMQLRPSESSGSVAGINLKLENATTARIQLFSDLSAGGNQNGFRNYDFPLTNSAALSLAIVLDYDSSTVEYFTNGVLTETFSDFAGTGIGTLQFSTASGWSSNHVVSINSLGFSKGNTVDVPVLAVDFNASDVTNNVQHEYFDFALNLAGAPQLTTPDYLGQPIYAGLELDPTNGWTTGIDDGGAYTNGGAISFGKNGSGAKLQWNGPNPSISGDDLGRYAENDVATGVFMFKKSDFLNGLDSGRVFMAGSNDTLNATIRLDAKTPARLKSGAFRWVVLDDGAYYISSEVTNLTADTGNVELTAEALDLSWNEYYPETSATAISNAALPTLQDIDAIGFWLSATILTNNGDRAYPNLQCSSFQAGASVAESSPTSLLEDWLAGFLLGSNTGLLDHADSDSLDNLTEYAFDGDPSKGALRGNVPEQSQVMDGGSNYIEYVYFEREDAADRGLSSSIDVGTDLVITNWADGSSFEIGSGAAPGKSGFNAVTNRIPIDAEVKKFIRLQIQFTP